MTAVAKEVIAEVRTKGERKTIFESWLGLEWVKGGSETIEMTSSLYKA